MINQNLGKPFVAMPNEEQKKGDLPMVPITFSSVENHLMSSNSTK